MIQRIQTLYLLMAAVLMSLTLFLPLATVIEGGNEIVIKAFTVKGLNGDLATQLPLYLGILLILPTLLTLVIIFLFKNRLLQIRLCVSDIVLQVGSLAFIGIYCYRVFQSVAGDEAIFTLGLTSLMPVISIIFMVLAIRAIAKDEALVRSLDRIR